VVAQGRLRSYTLDGCRRFDPADVDAFVAQFRDERGRRTVSRTAAVGRPPRQTPYRRTYPNGRVVWIARYLDGNVRYAKPRWNGDKSSFALKGDAQRPKPASTLPAIGPRSLAEASG
jgi:hypothetical protein